ncbi:MAG: IS4 family transposase [bacterium]|nr:IS4 family transposase [bacterium]
MYATKTVRNFLEKQLPFIHKRRLESLFFAVDALIAGGRLSLSGLGRAARGCVAPKHSIKRVDRLLGNSHLTQELMQIFEAITKHLLQGKAQPLILIDWTHLDEEFSSLSAAPPLDGRAIPIYWEVHPKKKTKNREVQEDFLVTLQRLVPENSKPIIVTDAGFQNPWFNAVSELGWDYVGRLSGCLCLGLEDEDWRLAPKFYPMAKKKNTDLGLCRVSKRSEDLRRVVLGKKFVRNRKRTPAKRRRSDRGRGNARAKQRSQEPWLIATSLDAVSADHIMKIYAQRMQIEENYRDLKNHRFGLLFFSRQKQKPKALFGSSFSCFHRKYCINHFGAGS